MSSIVKVGDIAPLFTAAGTGGRSYSLEDYRGKTVVLVFYPGDATAVCTEQLNSYNNSFVEFKDVDAIVLALSPQDVESHESFSSTYGFQFPLLYDKDKEIGKLYSVLGPLGFYRRSVVVIDVAGVVRYIKRTTAGLSYPSTEDLITAVKNASS